MAITTEVYDSRLEITIPAAYINIANFAGNKSSVNYTINIYASANARAVDRILDCKDITFSADPIEVTMAGLYAHLKTQPGFESATDC